MKSKILLALLGATAALSLAASADDLKFCQKENGHGQLVPMYRDTTTTVGAYMGGSGVNTQVSSASTTSANSYSIIRRADPSKMVILFRDNGCGCPAQ